MTSGSLLGSHLLAFRLFDETPKWGDYYLVKLGNVFK